MESRDIVNIPSYFNRLVLEKSVNFSFSANKCADAKRKITCIKCNNFDLSSFNVNDTSNLCLQECNHIKNIPVHTNKISIKNCTDFTFNATPVQCSIEFVECCNLNFTEMGLDKQSLPHLELTKCKGIINIPNTHSIDMYKCKNISFVNDAVK